MASNIDLTPVDQYLLSPDKPLWWELSNRISGFGTSSSLLLLQQLLPDAKDKWATVTYSMLSFQEQQQLEQLLKNKELDSDCHRYSNRKRKVSTTTGNQIVNPVLWGSALHATVKMDIIALKKEGCRIGKRHLVGLSVHGQRNRTTGKCSTLNGAKAVKSVKGPKKSSKK